MVDDAELAEFVRTRRRQRRVAALAGTMTIVLAAGVLAATARREPGAGVTTTPAPAGTSYELAWADGNDVLFVVVDGVARPTKHRAGSRLRGHDLSPDGRRLALVHEDNSVEVVELDGGRRRVELPPGDPRMEPAVAWAPDSRRLAVASTEPAVGGDVSMPDRRGVWVVDTETGTVTTVEHPFGGMRLTWSPDGRSLALERTDRGLPAGVDVVGLDGTHVRTLGRGKPWSLASSHAWSPDGRRLLVTWHTRQGNRLLAVDATSGTTTPVTDIGGYVWWRDARHLTWVREERSDVVEATLGGAVTRTVHVFADEPGYPPGTIAVRPAS